MDKILYPVHALNENITKILSKIISADIIPNIQKGFTNKIDFTDEGTHITCPAKISENYIEKRYKVILSAAYCQYLWLICDISLKK